MKLRVSRRAKRQIDRMDAWWVAHRPQAANLFADELVAIFWRIQTVSDVGVAWPTERRPKLRRVLMPRTSNHLYFEIAPDQQAVDVLAICGARRARAPKL